MFEAKYFSFKSLIPTLAMVMVVSIFLYDWSNPGNAIFHSSTPFPWKYYDRTTCVKMISVDGYDGHIVHLAFSENGFLTSTYLNKVAGSGTNQRAEPWIGGRTDAILLIEQLGSYEGMEARNRSIETYLQELRYMDAPVKIPKFKTPFNSKPSNI